MRRLGCCDSSLDMGVGNMGHIGDTMGQLLVGMDGIHSGWLGEAALMGLGRRSGWLRRWCTCQDPWVVQALLWLYTAQVHCHLVLDGTRVHMLGLQLAPNRHGGWLRLVRMELHGMVQIGLVNRGIKGLGGGLLCRSVLRGEG